MKSIETFVEPDPFRDMAIPPALEESLQRHRENLVRLIVSLRSAGISEVQIEESVSVIVASYKDELMRALKTLMR